MPKPLPGTAAKMLADRFAANQSVANTPVGLPADEADGPQGLCPDGTVNRTVNVSARTCAGFTTPVATA